jgi:hypothetical protein
VLQICNEKGGHWPPFLLRAWLLLTSCVSIRIRGIIIVKTAQMRALYDEIYSACVILGRNMATTHKNRARAATGDLRLQVKCVFAVVVMLLASCAQAWHTHGHAESLLHPSSSASALATSADDCPLCVAMHSAAPAPQPVVLYTAVTEVLAAPANFAPAHARVAPHSLYSRPPPSLG